MSTPSPISGMVTEYVNEVVWDTDFLRGGLFALTQVSTLAETVLGFGISNAALVSGFPCTPISPPGLSVVVGPGCLYSLQNLLPLAFGVYGPDTNANHDQYKQAILFDPVTLSTPAPSGAGNFVYYLIEIIDTPTQSNPSTSRPYYNSADPANPIYLEASDTYTDVPTFMVKAGTPGVSPTPPTPDAGYTPLYLVLVENGQTSIVSGNITVAPNAPFVTESLTQKAKTTTVQDNGYNYSTDTGSANTYVATISPVPGSYVTGLSILLLIANNNSGASTLNVNGLGAIAIHYPNGSTIASGDLVAGQVAILIYDGTYFQLQNPINGILPTTSVPSGAMLDFGGTSAPSGFLLCDGTSYLRATYPALFSAIGTTWGSVDGSHFNVPNFQRKVSVGSGGTGTGTLGNAVGNTGGTETTAVALNIGNMPAHNHTLNSAASPFVGGTSGGSFGFSGGGTDGIEVSTTDNTGDGTVFTFNIIQPSNIVLKIIKT